MKNITFRLFSLVLCAAGAIPFLSLSADEKKAADGTEVQSVRPMPPPPPSSPHVCDPGEKPFGFRPKRFGRPGGPGGPGHFLGRITPEEHAELNRLSMAGDREGFGRKLRELRKKYASPEDRAVDELSEKYLAAKTAEDKAVVRKELKEAVRKQFVRRCEFTAKQIADAEAKIARLKKFQENNLKHSDQIVEKITEMMCLPPEQRRKMRKGPPPPPPFEKNK